MDSSLFNDAYPEDKLHDHILEQYKVYVTNRQESSRLKHTSNSFFLATHSIIVTAVFLTLKNDFISVPAMWRYPILIGGLLLCVIWGMRYRIYRKVEKTQYEVIHELEARLPANCYYEVWSRLGKGEQKWKYLPLAVYDSFIPAIFILMYLSMMVMNITIPPEVVN